VATAKNKNTASFDSLLLRALGLLCVLCRNELSACICTIKRDSAFLNLSLAIVLAHGGTYIFNSIP
jgi:hypothetical protein